MGTPGNPPGIQGRADGAHHPVHHAAGGHNVRPGLRLGERNAREHLQRLVIQHVILRQ